MRSAKSFLEFDQDDRKIKQKSKLRPQDEGIYKIKVSDVETKEWYDVIIEIQSPSTEKH